jgi:hypothetical protein
MKIRFRINNVAVLAIGVLISLGSCKPKTNPEITTVDLRESLGYLASDSLQGRLPGSEGDILAGNYIAEKFAAYGIDPAGENGYFQNF